MIKTSEAIDLLSEALVKAQGKFSSAIKDSTNPAFRSKYADLTSVIAAMVPHLNSEGLAIMQHPSLEYKPVGDGVEAYVTITTRIQHKSGQYMESDLSIPAVMRERFDAQSVGSAITYGCRYGLQSIGVLGREDDDGAQAVGSGSKEAADGVAKQKIADHENKKVKPSLFWAWEDASQTATIVGDQALKTANKDLLAPLWSAVAGQLVATANQLEDLKYSLEQRKVPFIELKTGKGK